MRDIQDKTDGTGDILAAAAFNTNLINELQDFVVSAGFTLDPEAGPDTDTIMFSKSVCNYSVGAMYFGESGAADAYVLTRSGNIEALSSYFDGAIVCFNPGNDNTGASTINVDGLGVKNLVAADGTALTGGEVVADVYCIARYNSATDDFEIVKSAEDDAATLNGLASDTAATADTIAARDSSGDITANAFESTVATGTAPLTVASTTVVSNLNADLLDGQEGSYYAVDADVVHLAGVESIDDEKTFTSTTNWENTSGYSLDVNTSVNTKMLLRGSTDPWIAFSENTTITAYIQWKSDGYLLLQNSDDGSRLRLQDDFDFSDDSGATWYSIYHAGTSSASDTFTTSDAKTVTVVNGLITSIV